MGGWGGGGVMVDREAVAGSAKSTKDGEGKGKNPSDSFARLGRNKGVNEMERKNNEKENKRVFSKG